VTIDSAGQSIGTGQQLPTAVWVDAVSACVFSGRLWVGSMPWNFQPGTNPQFFLMNQVLPGTTLTLAPAT
jgi:hypothetical protein